jgi:hypothetical protein
VLSGVAAAAGAGAGALKARRKSSLTPFVQKSEWRSATLAAGLISAASFMLLAWQVGGYDALIGRVVVADVIAVACRLGAMALHVAHRP